MNAPHQHDGHGFHAMMPGVRSSISELARPIRILARPLMMNHERYAEEVQQGLHDKKKGSVVRGQGLGKTKANKSGGPSLFGEEGEA